MNNIDADFLVSIAIATYNGEKYLEQQLKSIYNQTYKNIEVIVSDDRSNDGTVEILNNYCNNHGLKYFVNASNLGVTKNFENAVSKCNGAYILLSDQDDVWLPNKIEVLLENIGEFSLIYSDGNLINPNSEKQEKKISEQKWMIPCGIDSTNKDFFKYALFNSFILGCSVMFKRGLLKDALPFYDSINNHDWWLVVCADNMDGVKYIDDTLFDYRIHSGNHSLKTLLKPREKFLDFFSAERKKTRQKIRAKEIASFIYISENLVLHNDQKRAYLKYILKTYFVKSSFIEMFRFFILLCKSSYFLFPRAIKFQKIFLIFQRFVSNANITT